MWNQLDVVTDALLDVGLSASSTSCSQTPLIEEGVQHVHPVNKHSQSFLRSWTHEVFSVQKSAITSLHVGYIPAALPHLNNFQNKTKTQTWYAWDACCREAPCRL